MDKKVKVEKKMNEYLKTFLITFGVVALFVCALFLIKWLTIPYELKNPKLEKQEEMDYFLIDFLIEKNSYLLAKFPKNYAYNIRLGTLYSIKKDYNMAEQHFKIAIDKSPYTAYRARYKLANLYIKLDRLQEAQYIMDSITDKADKKLIKNKGEIYRNIANKLYSEGFYAIAINKYEKSIFYFKKCSKKQMRETQKELVNAYIALGDMYVEKLMVEDAIDALKKADQISDLPEINYKLALLYLDSNPSLSAKYLDTVLKEAPEMLNYYMYYDLLLKIAESERNLGNKASADLYTYKANSFKKYVYENIIYDNDLLLEILDIETVSDKKNKNLNVVTKLRLRNNSPFKIQNLSINLIFKEKNHTVHTFTKQLFAYENFFPMGEQTSVIKLDTDINLKDLNKKEPIITVYVYAFKKEKYKHFLKTFDIKKPTNLVEF